MLSADLNDYYRVRQLPLYYFLSAVLYKAIGGPIFTFINLSSVAVGAFSVLGIAYAVKNAFGIHPLWSTFALLAMPLIVTNSMYGNEVSWSFGFLSLSLLMLTSRAGWLHMGAGVAYACACLCRVDLALALPYWILWAALFGPVAEDRTQLLRRLIKLGIVLAAAVIVLWMLLMRANPLVFPPRLWTTNLLLVVAILNGVRSDRAPPWPTRIKPFPMSWKSESKCRPAPMCS